MSYTYAVRVDNDAPVVTITVTGAHDVSRLVHLLERGNVEQGDLCRRLVRSLRSKPAGRAALEILRRHGGTDHTEEEA